MLEIENGVFAHSATQMGFAASCRVSNVPPCFRTEHLEPRGKRVLENNFLLQGRMQRLQMLLYVSNHNWLSKMTAETATSVAGVAPGS